MPAVLKKMVKKNWYEKLPFLSQTYTKKGQYEPHPKQKTFFSPEIIKADPENQNVRHFGWVKYVFLFCVMFFC